MHILFIVSAAFAAFICIILTVALFIKKEYFIEKDIVIDKPNDAVYQYIKLAKNQENYSKWWMLDPAKKMTYTGIDGTIGFIAAWDSDNKQVGKGEQEIKELREDKEVVYEIRFIKPMEGVSKSYLLINPVNKTETNVKWGFSGANKYPINLIFALLNLHKVLGTDLQQSLQNLKIAIEGGK